MENGRGERVLRVGGEVEVVDVGIFGKTVTGWVID